VSTEEALEKLGTSTGEAIADVLRMFCPDAVEFGKAAVIPTGTAPLGAIPVPAVAASVSYVNGVTGGNIFVMTRLGVRRLAAAMMGMDAMGVTDSEELSELDLSAAGEAMNQMMAAAAGATATVLGDEVEISPPETRFFATPTEAADAYDLTPHVTTVGFTLLGEPCRLVQLVPNAFVVRMKGAFDELAAQAAATDRERPEAGERISSDAVRAVPVRVWAELGRTQMPVGRAVGLATGAVVELDRAPDDPVDLFVNGRLFGTGRLLLVEDEWAVRIETVLPGANSIPEPDETLQGGTT
jgi:flagellar motor switch protein FliN/FliY